MIITWTGGENFTVKTKGLDINLGKKLKLGDLEISEPGEYEVGGVQLDRVDGIIQVYLEGINIGHIKKGKVLSDEEMEKLNGIDILIVGIGGGEFNDTKIAKDLISQIDPSIVIPMHSEDTEDVVKELGGSSEALAELKIAKADLPQETRKVVVLNVRK